jgi:hypothetical protein
MRLLLLFVLLFPLTAFCQYTTVSGVLAGCSGGKITANLTPAGQTFNSSGTPPPTPVEQTLDANGAFSMPLADNTKLSATNSQWRFDVCAKDLTTCVNTTLTISGATQSITGSIPALACTSGGGGGGLPTGVANGSALVSNGVNQPAVYQVKPVFDVRDYGAVQNGTTDDAPAVVRALTAIGSNPATLLFTGISALSSIAFPSNVTLQFSQNGGLKAINSSTVPGGAGFVQGSGIVNGAVLTNSCSVTLTGTTAGNAIIFMENHYYTGSLLLTPPTDTGGNRYSGLLQQGYNLTSVNTSWAASNITGGTVTVTLPLVATVANSCIAWEISGMGPIVGLDAGVNANENRGAGTLTMAAGPVTTTTGALLIGYGGQTYKNETCTQGTGYTQPAGAAGSVGGQTQPVNGYGESLCAEYRLVSPGGAQSATQTITDDPASIPLNRYWSYSIISVIPTSAKINIQGTIISPVQQIFYNANPGQGTIDLTNNTAIDKVFPEWWGAAPVATAAVNTPALQAAINGAYGTNRVNGSTLNNYNRELHFSGLYNVNGTLNVYHMNGFKWTCSQRAACGLNETTVNTTLFNGQSVSYGVFEDFAWSSTVAQDIAHPLVIMDYTGAQGADLSTQFIDFHRNAWQGGGLAAIGFQVSPAGGGAQGSNIYFHNNLASGFTEACYMIGSGSGGVATTIATNAVAITWFGGDVQGCTAYGIEDFGGGLLKIDGTTFENGFNTQTGYDIFATSVPAGGGVEIDDVRSESLFLFGGSCAFYVKNSFTVDQAAFLGNPGTSPAVGQVIQGSQAGGHGVYYKITVSGALSGLGQPAAPLSASSGSATTLVDSVGGLTVNAWIGWYVSVLSGTGANQYCVVTSNTATTFTCTAGWVTDFNTITTASPDATSRYIVEPAWGTQTTSGGATWAGFTKYVGGGNESIIDGLFVPGLTVNTGGIGSVRNLQVTRTDWYCTISPSCFALDGLNVSYHYDGVLVGVPSGGQGTGAGVLGTVLLRNWSFKRNSGISAPISNFTFDQKASVPVCWGAGTAAGLPTVDICLKPDPNGAGTLNGRLQLINNSSGSLKITNFNADGSTSFAGPIKLSVIPTVATLPTCNAGAEGTFNAVSDAAAAPVYNAIVAAGGTVHIPVYCNGTNWVNH